MRITTIIIIIIALICFYIPSRCCGEKQSHLTNSDSSFKALLFRRVPLEQKTHTSTNSAAPLLCEMNCLSAGGKGGRFIKTSSSLQLNYEVDTLACIPACSGVSACVTYQRRARVGLYKVAPSPPPFAMETSLEISVSWEQSDT